MSAPRNLNHEWARLLLGTLEGLGLRSVVVSPGSRSTPLVVALSEFDNIRVHSILDERAAAFFALGQTRVTGQPTALICTSGTAPAHYLPTVIEAQAAGLPLLMITADRPPELTGAAAPQAIDQLPLFQGYAKRVLDLGTPDAEPRALDGLRRVAAQAMILCRQIPAGPVHLNFRARKPLEPPKTLDEPGEALRAAVDARLANLPKWAPAARLPNADAIAEAARTIAAHSRGLILVGPRPVFAPDLEGSLAALAKKTGYPVVAEAASQLRNKSFANSEGVVLLDAIELMLEGGGLPGGPPEVLLEFGGVPTSSALLRLMGEVPTRIRVSDGRYQDPVNGAVHFIEGGDAEVAAELAQRAQTPREPSSFLEGCHQAQTMADHVKALALNAAGTDEFHSEGTVTQEVSRCVENGALLFLGNSLAIRAYDAFWVPRSRFRILHQRGVNGIDGNIAGLLGAASVTDKPVYALLGDLAFLHDAGALLLARRCPTPLVIVVLDNHGGRIFERLPIADVVDDLTPFITPQSVDWPELVSAYGAKYHECVQVNDFVQGLSAARERAQVTVIRVQVPRHGAETRRQELIAAFQKERSAP